MDTTIRPSEAAESTALHAPLLDPIEYADLAPLAPIDPYVEALEQAAPHLGSVHLTYSDKKVLYNILVVDPEHDYADIAHVYDNCQNGCVSVGDIVVIGDETGERLVTLTACQVARYYDTLDEEAPELALLSTVCESQ